MLDKAVTFVKDNPDLVKKVLIGAGAVVGTIAVAILLKNSAENFEMPSGETEPTVPFEQ